jgi:phage shock protein PspC (stress-responsive transcriptional regulator)
MSSTFETPPAAPTTPPEPPPPPVQPRLLRRSVTNRVAAGVSGGLGEYFGVDPVLFRVLFATTAFFGGAGILAYVIAWAAIPEQGAAHAPIDRLMGSGRRSSAPMWVLIVIASIIVWALLFSWWAPWRFLPWMFLPLLFAALVLAGALSRRPAQAPPTAGPPPPDATAQPDATTHWVAEARAAARERRRRSAPVRWATLGAIVVVLTILGIIDATAGIAIPVYLWAVLLVVVAGLLVGALLRRPVWWLSLLLVPVAMGLFVFAGSRASLSDGSGYNYYTPRTAAQLQSTYNHAYGKTTLDLTTLPSLDAARTVHVRLAGGEVRLVIPPSLPVNVHANVHLGDVRIDGREDSSGMNISSDPITTASEKALTVDVQLTAGQLQIDRSP